MNATREPLALNATIGVVLTSVVALLALLVPDTLTPAIAAAVIVLGNAIIVAVTTYLARKQVTPVADPILPVGTPVTTPTGGSAVVVAPLAARSAAAPRKGTPE